MALKQVILAALAACLVGCKEPVPDPPKTETDIMPVTVSPSTGAVIVAEPVPEPLPPIPEVEPTPEVEPIPEVEPVPDPVPDPVPAVPAPAKDPTVDPNPPIQSKDIAPVAPPAVTAPEPGQPKTEKTPWFVPVHVNPPVVIESPAVPIKESDYERRWRTLKIRDGWQGKVNWSADKIEQNIPRYVKVQDDVGVPWYVISVLHNMEASLRFDKHLHNGNPLTARTYWVPKGRPVGGKPPFTWEFSAADALRYDKLDKVTDWSVHHLLYTIERYNGTGYIRYHKDVPTPYLWSGSQHYTSGKYVSDGKWDQKAVSQQVGAAVILKELSNRGLLSIK